MKKVAILAASIFILHATSCWNGKKDASRNQQVAIDQDNLSVVYWKIAGRPDADAIRSQLELLYHDAICVHGVSQTDAIEINGTIDNWRLGKHVFVYTPEHNAAIFCLQERFESLSISNESFGSLEYATFRLLELPTSREIEINLFDLPHTQIPLAETIIGSFNSSDSDADSRVFIGNFGNQLDFASLKSLLSKADSLVKWVQPVEALAGRTEPIQNDSDAGPLHCFVAGQFGLNGNIESRVIARSADIERGSTYRPISLKGSWPVLHRK